MELIEDVDINRPHIHTASHTKAHAYSIIRLQFFRRSETMAEKENDHPFNISFGAPFTFNMIADHYY